MPASAPGNTSPRLYSKRSKVSSGSGSRHRKPAKARLDKETERFGALRNEYTLAIRL